MITVLSWLIANLETLCLVILTVITILKVNITDESGLNTVAGIGLIAYFIFATISSAKSFWGSLIIALIAAFVHLYLYTEVNSMFWVVFIPTLVVSIAVGIFTAIFKDAVISRRMLYVNSGVSMFEFSLLYALNRFFSAFSCMTIILLFSVYFKEIVEELFTKA